MNFSKLLSISDSVTDDTTLILYCKKVKTIQGRHFWKKKLEKLDKAGKRVFLGKNAGKAGI